MTVETPSYPGALENHGGRRNVTGTLTLGAAGAVTSWSFQGGKVTNISKTTTGRYRITLSRTYVAFRGLEIALLKATDAGIARFQVLSEDVNGTKEIVFCCYNHNSPADAANPVDCVLYMTIKLDDLPGA